MSTQPQDQATSSLQAKQEKSQDSPRYTPPTVDRSERLTAITGSTKVTA